METKKIVSAKEAAAAIEDGSTVVVCGCENILLPDYLLRHLEERFLETGHPCGLTELHTVIHGMGPGLGLEHFAHPGMIKRVIGSGYSFFKTSRMSALIRENTTISANSKHQINVLNGLRTTLHLTISEFIFMTRMFRTQ